MTVHTPKEGVNVPNGIFIPGGLPLAQNYVGTTQALLSRVKVTADTFAEVNGMDPDYVKGVLEYEREPNAEFLSAIDMASPLNVRELIDSRYKHMVPIFDDSDNQSGVKIMSATQSNSEVRRYRRGQEAPSVNYYDYFRTASQKPSPIVPEKIIELHEHDPLNPDLHDDYFNEGHRERQVTVAIGDVNYHWMTREGEKRIIPAKTGDANAFNQYTRHSFTTPPGKQGYILAITDVGAIGMEFFQSLISNMSQDEYLSLMKKIMPVIKEPTSFDEHGGFMFRRYADAKISTEGPYTRRILMDGITFHPTLVASEYQITPGGDESLDLRVNANIFGYNHGETPVMLRFGTEEREIEPGASFSMQPNIAHAYRASEGLAKLIVMESNPILENPAEQAALIDRFTKNGIARLYEEDRQWFNEATE